MQRRTFLQLSSLTAMLAPWLSGCTDNFHAKGTMATPQTLGLFCSHEELMAIGKSYCEANAEECTQPSLEKHLLNDGGKSFPKTDTSALEDFLNQKITNEFKAGDLTLVNGWILSHTEARQIALYSLS